MPKLTDPLSRPREVPRLGGNVVLAPDPGPNDANAKGLQLLGRALGEGAEDMYRAQKIEEERINTLVAEDAFTRLREKQLELTSGEADGFIQQRGAAAVTRPIVTEWTKRFDSAETSIAAGLTNDAQRQKFKSRSAVSRLQYQDDLLRHLAQQSNVYSEQVYNGTMAIEQRNAVARWDSPNDVALSLGRIAEAVNDRAERFEWAPEYRTAMLQIEQGKVHSAVVGQAIANGRFKFAEDWYNEHRADIDLMTARQLEVAVRNGEQKELTAAYNASFLASRDDPKGLRALEDKLLSDKTLDPDSQNMLVGRVLSRMDVLDRRAVAFQEHKNAEVGRAIAAVNQNTMKGFEPTTEQMAPVLDAAKGTPQEQAAAQMVQLANATREFRRSTPLQQEKFLAEFEAAARKDPTRFDIRTRDALRSIHDEQKRQIEDDPVSFATKQGWVEPQPLDITDPVKSAESVQERYAISRSLQKTVQAPLKPLTVEEVALGNKFLRQAGVDAKRQYFADLAAASGNDSDGYIAVMAQLAPDDPVTAIAGVYAHKKRQGAADHMLRGQALLRPNRKEDGQPDKGKIWPMPPEKELANAFSEYEKQAFASEPDRRNALFQASRAIYADMSAAAGDGSGEFDSERFEHAMHMATGGIYFHRGKGLQMPYGYDKSRFTDELDRKVKQMLIRAEGPTTKVPDLNDPAQRVGRIDSRITHSKLMDLPLERIEDGRYVFRSGDSIMGDLAGNPLIIDFNEETPPQVIPDIKFGPRPSEDVR